MFSLIIPVYRNEANLGRLLPELVRMAHSLDDDFEVVFVVDGSPDRCFEILRNRLPVLPLNCLLVSLTRNFGSFAAIAAGLECARGDYFAVLAADLQEPPELPLAFLKILRNDTADIVFGCRRERSDPLLSDLTSRTFWTLYRRFVVKDMPPGGVDIFGCNRKVRDRLLQFRELNTNLIALLFWIGYRREYVSYDRLPRLEGRSAWTLRKKLRYSFDSVFNFTDLPIQLLLLSGMLALLLACFAVPVLVFAKLRGDIHVPGYTPIVLAILFFGALTSIGFGIIGQYLWLTLQNTRERPTYIISSLQAYDAVASPPSGHPPVSEREVNKSC